MPPDRSPSLLHMAAPLVVSFWMRAAVTFVDTAYAATIGDAAVAAIGLLVPVEFVMIAVWVGLSTGLTSALSRAMGARAGRRIAQYLRLSWRIVWIIAPAFTLLGAAAWWLTPFWGLEPEVSHNFQIYATVLIAGSAWTTFWSIVPDSVIKAHQATRATMWAGIWTNLINVILNTIFLFVFEWGIFGIALSTVLGRIAGLLYAVVAAARLERAHRVEAAEQDCTLDEAPLRRIFGLALPASLTFALIAVETGVINELLKNLPHATQAIAAYSIYYRVALFALQPVIATAVAMLPFAARRFGEGDWQSAWAGVRQASIASVVYSVAIVGPVMLWVSDPLARWLSEEPLTAEYAAFALKLVPLTCLTGALFLICRPVFEAMNRGRPGLVMAGVRYILLTGPFAILGMRWAESAGLPSLHGLLGGLMVAATISSIGFYVWLQRAIPRAPAI